MQGFSALRNKCVTPQRLPSMRQPRLVVRGSLGPKKSHCRMWHRKGSIVGGFLRVLRLPPPFKNNNTVAVHFQIQNKSDLYLRSKNKFPSVIAEPFAPRVCNLSVLVSVRMVNECVWSRYSVRRSPRFESALVQRKSAYVMPVLLLFIIID